MCSFFVISEWQRETSIMSLLALKWINCCLSKGLVSGAEPEMWANHVTESYNLRERKRASSSRSWNCSLQTNRTWLFSLIVASLDKTNFDGTVISATRSHFRSLRFFFFFQKEFEECHNHWSSFARPDTHLQRERNAFPCSDNGTRKKNAWPRCNSLKFADYVHRQFIVGRHKESRISIY